MMILEDLIGVIEKSDRLRIYKGGEEVFIGFVALLMPIYGQSGDQVYKSIRDKEVKKLRVVPEIRHKEWERSDLMRPLQPEEMPEFCFSDLQMSLYYTIYI